MHLASAFVFFLLPSSFFLPAAAQQSASSEFIGTQECRGCHNPIFLNFEATPHWKTTFVAKSLKSAAPSKLPAEGGRAPSRAASSQNLALPPEGCEACHGPGRAHADGLGDPKKIVGYARLTRAEITRRCLTCHQYSEEHGNFRRSAHRAGSVACLDCHSVHHFGERQYLLRKTQTELCTGCHANTMAEFARPFHHRVPEKLLTCTECHNQHGGFLTRQLRSTAAQESVCGQCHSETVGPFVFEHAPLKSEGCNACHQPHGSVNARLLKRAQVNQLCLECHTLSRGNTARDTPAFHSQDRQFQACTLCHVAIHGSNVSEKLLR